MQIPHVRRVRRPSLVALLSLVALAAVLQVAGAASSTSAYAGRVGVNTHLVWVSQADSQPVFSQLRAGGVEWVREEFPWSVVEPQRGNFSWSRTDAMMAAAANAGVNVLGILVYSAPWASSDPSGAGDTKYPPRSNADYARYAAAVVSRYGPGGAFWASRPDLPPRPLTAVQVWNEPWGHWFWKPNPSPSAYAALARAAATAVRAANPDVKILIAGDLLQVRTDGAIVDWLTNLRAADPGLAGLADAYSVHPYPYPRTRGPYDDRSDARWDFRRVTMIHDIDPSLPIWITEVGWSTANTSDSVSEATQAEHVRGVLERALVNWGSYVERVFVYSFDRDNGNTSDREAYYGLRRQDGSPKPAWDAMTTLLAGPVSSTPPDSDLDPEPEPEPEPQRPVPTFTVTSLGLTDGQRVSGSIVWEAVPSGAPIAQVDFAIDGSFPWTERITPYRYLGDAATLDTRTLTNGQHRLTATATATDGTTATTTVTVDVRNKRGRR